MSSYKDNKTEKERHSQFPPAHITKSVLLWSGMCVNYTDMIDYTKLYTEGSMLELFFMRHIGSYFLLTPYIISTDHFSLTHSQKHI